MIYFDQDELIILQAPLSLAATLQEYLDSPDFDSARKAYLEKGKIATNSIQNGNNIATNAKSGWIDVFGDTGNSSTKNQVQATQPNTSAQLDFFADMNSRSGAVVLANTNNQQVVPATNQVFHDLNLMTDMTSQQNVSRQSSQLSNFGAMVVPQMNPSQPAIQGGLYMHPTQGSFSQPILPSQSTAVTRQLTLHQQASQSSFMVQSPMSAASNTPMFGGTSTLHPLQPFSPMINHNNALAGSPMMQKRLDPGMQSPAMAQFAPAQRQFSQIGTPTVAPGTPTLPLTNRNAVNPFSVQSGMSRSTSNASFQSYGTSNMNANRPVLGAPVGQMQFQQQQFQSQQQYQVMSAQSPVPQANHNVMHQPQQQIGMQQPGGNMWNQAQVYFIDS